MAIQKYAIKTEHKVIIQLWWKDRRNEILIISGYAGCGKTTLARRIPELIRASEVVFMAPTGKAATVIGGDARTIHSYLYIPVKDEKTGKVTFDKKPWEDFNDDLLIVDEISMVNEELLQDLKNTGVPIIGLGDPAQLPPVQGTNEILNNPDIFLTEVFRNDGGVLALATDIRMKNKLKFSTYNNVKIGFTGIEKDLHLVDDDSIIICKLNATRQHINRMYRKDILGYKLPLQNGEKLIVLQNNKWSGLMNGSIVTVEDIVEVKVADLTAVVKVKGVNGFMFDMKINLDILMKREPRSLRDEQMHLVDYAYAITCHKAQGSEYKNVFIINEKRWFSDHRAWYYTAVTRAKEKVYIYN